MKLIVSMLIFGGVIVKLLYIKLFKVFHAQRNKNRVEMNQYDLSPGQPKTMRYIDENPCCKLKDIAHACDIEPATASKMLSCLTKKGFIDKCVNPDNKRSCQFSLTEKGKYILEKWNEHCLEIENEALRDFDDDERQQLEEYLERMYKNLTGKSLE